MAATTSTPSSSPSPWPPAPHLQTVAQHLSTLEVFYHQAEQSKDRVTNKDPILSDWILLCDGLCYCHLLICIKVVCQEMQLLLSACTSQK
ncbi:hypothetical protein PVAP13_3KG156600 [Panicum virgatum]|uniref:Uncharacterized protein n=1 Tax=Panicum virgatum TaxID=38727 RepID=A0A8T0UXW1_PANVG|nr:hypothetical protein PVAP13_3KG156600 [Panicum virgatum]